MPLTIEEPCGCIKGSESGTVLAWCTRHLLSQLANIVYEGAEKLTDTEDCVKELKQMAMKGIERSAHLR